MSDINGNDPIGGPAPVPVTQQPSQTDLVQEDFLSLMVAQIQNQDPFQPMESGEFFTQIAQFGTVSGLEDIQASIDAMAASLVSDQSLAAASLVGRDVLVPADGFDLQQGGTVQGAVEVPYDMDEVTVTIKDGTGAVVAQIPLGAQSEGLADFQWDGLDSSGEPVPPGHYTLEVTGTVDGETLALEGLLEAEVTSVTLGSYGQEMMVDLEGIGEVPYSDVRRIS